MSISIMSYVGGKGKMASYLVELLDRSKSSYAEVFGGMCRTLLNAPPHKDKEYYLDTSRSLCSLVKVLSNKDRALDFIRELEKVEVSKEYFEECREIKELYEGYVPVHSYNKVTKLLRKFDKDYGSNLAKQFPKYIYDLMLGTDGDNLINNMSNEIISAIKAQDNLPTGFFKYEYTNFDYDIVLRMIPDIWFKFSVFKNAPKVTDYHGEERKKLSKRLCEIRDFCTELRFCLSIFVNRVNRKIIFQKAVKAVSTSMEKYLRDYAKNKKVSLYELITGKYGFSVSRFKSFAKNQLFREHLRYFYLADKAYVGQIDKELEMKIAVSTYVTYKCSRDAMGETYSTNMDYEKFHNGIIKLENAIDRLQGVKVIRKNAFKWIEEQKKKEIKDLMVFCDPPYVNQAKDKSSDEDIDLNKKLPDFYKTVIWTVQTHRDFLEIIKDVPFSAMVCNYDDGLYDEYLKSEDGWTKFIYPTTVVVGGKEGNFRNECVWINY